VRCTVSKTSKNLDWIHLAQDEDQWRDLLLKVMKIPVPNTGLIFTEKPRRYSGPWRELIMIYIYYTIDLITFLK